MLEEKVSQFIEKERLLEANQTIIVGVSGGSDSLALLYYLWEEAKEKGYQLIVAHVDHMFRGAASAADADFVQETCQKLNIVCESVQVNVPEVIAKTGKNPQQASRDARYQFYQQLMEKHQADKLALGHHLDDQAENMLMYLARGVIHNASIAIPTRRVFATGEIVRPFLAVSKDEIRAFCARKGLQPREDASNEKEMYARNRFRKHLLPLLKEENSQVLTHFQQFAQRLQADEDFLQALATSEFEKLAVLPIEGGYSVSLAALQKLSNPLQRRVVPLILNYLKEVKYFSLSSAHLDMILEMFQHNRSSLEVQLDEDLRVAKSFDRLIFYFESELVSEYEMELVVPGITRLPNGSRIVASVQSTFCYEDDPNIFFMGAEPGPLKIRNKRDGDRIRIPNLNGHKKVKKSFLEHKTPVYLRDAWPVVTFKEEVIWVPGLQKGDVSENIQHAQSFIKLHFQAGGTGHGDS